MRFVWIIVMSLSYLTPQGSSLGSIKRKWIQTLSVPWVGILSYRETKTSKEAIAGITLIKTNVGLANANDVASIPEENIRNTTKAMFLTLEATVESSPAIGYILHPEYTEYTLNTIALVYLEYNEAMLKWNLMDWPKYKEDRLDQYGGDVYLLGYTDEHAALEQVMHKMEFFSKTECDQYCKKEKMESLWLTPIVYECFKTMYRNDKCLLESGMALAGFSGQKWTMLGISVLGPGCGVPSRFIDFGPYVPWVWKLTGKEENLYLPLS